MGRPYESTVAPICSGYCRTDRWVSFEETSRERSVTGWLNAAKAQSKLQRFDEAIESLKAGLRHHPNDRSLLFEMGRILGMLGRYEDAIASYEQIFGREPSAYDALANAGLNQCYLGNWNAALDLFSRGLEVKPSYEFALTHKSHALYNLEDFESAETCAADAVQADERSDMAWNNWGACLVKLGRIEEANGASKRL